MTSAHLAVDYGPTDLGGSQPNLWAYKQAIEHGDKTADPNRFR